MMVGLQSWLDCFDGWFALMVGRRLMVDALGSSVMVGLH